LGGAVGTGSRCGELRQHGAVQSLSYAPDMVSPTTTSAKPAPPVPTPATRRTHRQWGLRSRSVAVAMAVVSIALLLGGIVLLLVLSSTLTAAAQANLTVRAADIAHLVEEEGLAETRTTLREDRRGGELIQLLDQSGTIVASSDSRLRQPMSTLRPSAGRTSQERLRDPAAPDAVGEYLVAAQGFTVAREHYVLLVATPVQVQADTVRTVGWLLLAATPFLVALVGVAVWVLVGRSLQTVERIRRQVAEIDAKRLGDRVEVPNSADEIAALAATMNDLLDELETADRTQRAFFSDASHELRSPLSTVITTAEVASRDPSGRTWTELQGTVLTESRRMQELVEDLLTLAKVDSQSLQLKWEDVDLEDVIGSELQRLRDLGQVIIAADLIPARIRGDERRLTQVFRNLLDNAARHAHSTVAVQLRLSQGSVRVAVDNDGEAIPEGDRDRIFGRFVRLDDSRANDRGGSGLGLAIVREIVNGHGGSVAVVDTRPDWCRFEVVLPLP
jgi:signal transduction histidine kinase